MSTSTATPGPWTVVWPIPPQKGVKVRGRGGHLIAILGSSDRDWLNARLIACAPDLYTALRDLVQAAGNPSPELLKRAAAVLADAEGGDNG